MSARNAAKTLKRAIGSLLLQSMNDWELILIDDGSTDKTASIASGFNDPRIRVLSDGRKRGLAVRLNQALTLSRGEYFARLDADDIAFPDRLRRQLGFLQEHRDTNLIGSGAVVFSISGAAIGSFPVRCSHEEICRNPWSGFYLAHPTWMAGTAWLKSYGYCTDLARAQDQDLLLRSYRNSRFACLPEPLIGYAQDSLSLKKVLASRFYFSRALARHALRTGQRLVGTLGLLSQCFKGAVDTLAIMSGLEQELLSHRTLPINQADVEKWNQCWLSVVRLVSA